MHALALLSFIFAALPVSVLAQGSQVPILYDQTHNATDITGTWSTGSGAVLTGSGFANPVNFSFNPPKTTGRSIAFTDQFFEQADYRITSNATDPRCITGVLTWQHGTYELLPNGSILLNPFAADGRQQVQDRCAPISNQITQWNSTVLFLQWRIFPLPSGGFHLNLYEFDGSPVAPMSLIAKPPTMLPTQVLTDPNKTVNAPPAVTNSNPSRRSNIEARSDAPRKAIVTGGIAGLAGVGAMVLLLVL